MQKTTHYQLNKPESADPLRLADFNGNADIIDAALAGCARVEYGTYTGTGTYGETNQNKLTFSFVPKLVFVFTTTSYGALAHTSASGNSFSTANQVFYYGGSAFNVYHSEHAATYYTISENGLSWHNALSARAQMNQSGTTYGYIAIG